MEKKKTIDLIKLEVLGCINQKDFETLRIAKESDLEFPWKELGQYQNLVALLPSALTFEFPPSELKDKVALKLYNVRDEIKAKLDAKKAPEEPLVLQEEDQITIDDEINIEEVNVPLKVTDQPQISITEKPELKRQVEETVSKTDVRAKAVFDKELVEKTVREYIKNYLEGELRTIKQSLKKNLIISLVFFVISLALIIFLYLQG